jgi:hypothetical protein
VNLISRYGILGVVYSQVLKLGKKLGRENRWWIGIILSGSQQSSLCMLFFFGLLFMMLLLLQSICVVGAILEIVYAFFFHAKQENQDHLFFECDLNKRIWKPLMAECGVADPSVTWDAIFLWSR